MSIIDVDHWADTLINRYADHDVIGNALFPLTLAHAGAANPPEPIPLDDHPVPFLARYRRPPGCLALGLVSAGWAAPIDSKVRASAHPDAQRILQCVVLACDGAIGGRLRMPDGTIHVGAPGYGAVLDALRVTLGLPTAA